MTKGIVHVAKIPGRPKHRVTYDVRREHGKVWLRIMTTGFSNPSWMSRAHASLSLFREHESTESWTTIGLKVREPHELLVPRAQAKQHVVDLVAKALSRDTNETTTTAMLLMGLIEHYHTATTWVRHNEGLIVPKEHVKRIRELQGSDFH